MTIGQLAMKRLSITIIFMCIVKRCMSEVENDEAETSFAAVFKQKHQDVLDDLTRGAITPWEHAPCRRLPRGAKMI